MSTPRPAIDLPELDSSANTWPHGPLATGALWVPGIIAIVPRGGDAAGIVTRMWTDESIVVKHLAEPDQPEGIRLSFWALHQPRDLEHLAAAFARCLAVRA